MIFVALKSISMSCEVIRTMYIHAVSSIGVRVATRSHCNPPAGRFDITTHRLTESGSDPSSTVSSVGVRETVASFG